jgi:uncharacterized membrane protein
MVLIGFDRIYLLEHIANYASDPKVKDLLEKYDIQYIYYNQTVVEGGQHVFSPVILSSHADLDEVFNNGQTRIYKIK